MDDNPSSLRKRSIYDDKMSQESTTREPDDGDRFNYDEDLQSGEKEKPPQAATTRRSPPPFSSYDFHFMALWTAVVALFGFVVIFIAIALFVYVPNMVDDKIANSSADDDDFGSVTPSPTTPPAMPTTSGSLLSSGQLNEESIVRECSVVSYCADMLPAAPCQVVRCLELIQSDSQFCLLTPLPVGSSCDDSDTSTAHDVCTAAGQCSGATSGRNLLEECTAVQEASCPATPDCQILSLCVLPVGVTESPSCVFEPDPESYGDMCDDNNPFTSNDRCTEQGECRGTPVNNVEACSQSQYTQGPTSRTESCVEIACLSVAGQALYSTVAKPDGTPCSDPSAGTCHGSVCVPSSSKR